MSERKVLNKYFPPDFDPNFTPVDKPGGSGQHKVRLMAPFSMRCATCGDYIYKGKKFNARKEIAWGYEYLDIKTYRFYIRCPRCSAEITFRTDPKNADYVAENGITRNFEPWREEKFAIEEKSYRKQMEEALDPMRKLENKTVDSKREIDILEALDEVRTRNARFEKLEVDSALEVLEDRERAQKEKLEERKRAQDEEDERLAREAFKHKNSSSIDDDLRSNSASVKKRKFQQEEKATSNKTSSRNLLVKKASPSSIQSQSLVSKETNSNNEFKKPAPKTFALVSYDDEDDDSE